MALLDPSFETAADPTTDDERSAGNAQSWTWSASSSVYYASFPTATGRSRWDGFEFGWGSDPFFGTLEDTSPIAVAFASGSTKDGFESGWSNDGFLFEIGLASQALYGATEHPPGLPPETFEINWLNNQHFIFAFSSELVAATYLTVATPDAFDGFETKWNGNETYIVTFTSELTAAVYTEGDGTGTAETFEGMILDQPFSVDPATSVITATAHGRSNGDRVKFFSAIDGTGGNLPAGISDRIKYFVINATTNTLKISETLGGPAQTIADVGSGASFLRGDPAKNWVGADGDSAGSDP